MTTPQDKVQCVAWFIETRLLSMYHEERIITVSWYVAERSLMLCCIPWSFLLIDISNLCKLLMSPTDRWSPWWCPSAFCWKILLHWKVWSGISEACHIWGIPWGVDIVSSVVVNKNNEVNKNKCCGFLYHVQKYCIMLCGHIQNLYFLRVVKFSCEHSVI